MTADPHHHDLAAGTYRARISRIGAALLHLRDGPRPLVFATDAAVPTPAYRGAVLAPWPNRLADGCYTYGGAVHQLPITEIERRTALHGLVLYHPWELSDADDARAVLTTELRPRPGYPFALDLRVEYRLDEVAGLQIGLQARNVGDRSAPYGTSIHPYLCADEGRVDDWTFTVAADAVVDVDPVRLLPTVTRPVDGTPFDFRVPTPIGAREIDHALTQIAFDAAGSAEARLIAPDGRGVRMTWDRACGWLQVHTTDLPGQREHRRGLAVEPMTCAPDAFNSADGLITLAPGAVHDAAWTIGSC